MITNTGKNIIAKYMIGQAPAYASYIAVGCGPKPLLTGSSPVDYSEKQSLDFEMFRVPIISRGYVAEDNTSKIVFTAELPTQERYEITEVGIYSAASNQSAGSADSRTIYSFSDTETWEYHTLTESSQIPTISAPLDGENNDNIIIGEYDINSTGTPVDCPVIQTNADNRIFTNQNRIDRYEGSRFLNNTVLLRGDISNLELDVNNYLQPDATSTHIHITGVSIDFNKNAPTDELRFAFSLINKDGESVAIPDSIKILVDFASTDVLEPDQFARFETTITHTPLDPIYDFSTNRYFVSTKQLQQLHKTSGFTWNTVDVVKIYATVFDGGIPSGDYYVALDAIRLENVSSTTPLYGLTGYSVVKTEDTLPLIKYSNTSNYVEFKFGMGVA